MNASERLYRLLLMLYPREHRREYGELMVTHFRDQLRTARGKGALLRLWVRTLLDVAATAPVEQFEAARRGKARPWFEVLLVSVPVVVALLLAPQSDGAERLLLLGMGAVYTVMLFFTARRGWSAAWALPMLGLAGTFAATWVAFLLLGQWRWPGQQVWYPLLTLLAGVVFLLRPLVRHGKRSTAALLGLMLVGSMVVYWSQGVAAAVAVADALEAPALILLATVLGLPIARRYGSVGALFVVGSLQWAIEATIDPSLQIRFGDWSTLLSMLNVGATLIVIPLLALRARSDRGRALAILASLASLLALLVVLPPLVYTLSAQTAGAVDTSALIERAIGNAAYAAQILAGMAFALSLYGAVGRGDAEVETAGNDMDQLRGKKVIE